MNQAPSKIEIRPESSETLFDDKRPNVTTAALRTEPGFNLDSAVRLSRGQARWNPGVAKASNCKIAKSFCASHFVVTSFNVPSKHRCSMSSQRQTASPPQADQPSAETLLRKGCASRFLSSATAESGFKYFCSSGVFEFRFVDCGISRAKTNEKRKSESEFRNKF
jgi:hypothetical protein